MVSSKNKIALAAFELSLLHGFDNVSVKQISEESGVAVGSIYYHFKDKDEILVYMVHMYLMDNFHEFKEEVRNFEGSFMERMEFIFTYKTSSFIQEEENFYASTDHEFDYKKYFTLLTNIYHQNPESRPIFYELHDQLYDFYYKLVQDAIKNGELRDDVDIEMLVMFIQTIFKGYIDLWVYQPNFSFKKLVDANAKLMWEAIKKQ
ncbi:MAG: TetR/AcrR family transcriptional regulator [Methanobacteriaceae archaeon]|jgi:AcrR family transcriptional regulator|nr:TetR/AcrR family transcriptional regulator [Candidatus Methanorudis spinitermitis]